jgi:hypothetical protein
MEAEIRRIEPHAFLSEQIDDPLLHGHRIVGLDEPAADARLVAYDHERVAESGGCAQPIGSSSEQRDGARITGVAHIVNERAVAIEQKGTRHCAAWPSADNGLT